MTALQLSAYTEHSVIALFFKAGSQLSRRLAETRSVKINALSCLSAEVFSF